MDKLVFRILFFQTSAGPHVLYEFMGGTCEGDGGKILIREKGEKGEKENLPPFHHPLTISHDFRISYLKLFFQNGA
jgi:hypothetical protein